MLEVVCTRTLNTEAAAAATTQATTACLLYHCHVHANKQEECMHATSGLCHEHNKDECE
jgi:hypothetical protein